MIDPITHIKAIVQPVGSRAGYQEFKFPATNTSNECYIEIVTNERFEIGIRVPADFDYKGYSHLSVECEIDGGAGLCRLIHEKQKISGRHSYSHGSTQVKRVGRELKVIGFTFGKVSIDDRVHLSKAEEDTEVARRGKITMTVQRGLFSREPRGQQPRDPAPIEPLPLRSNRWVVSQRSHSYRPVILNDNYRGPEPNVNFSPAIGEAGRKVVYTFYYVSRKIIEHLQDAPDLASPSHMAQRTDDHREISDGDRPRKRIKSEIAESCSIEYPPMVPSARRRPKATSTPVEAAKASTLDESLVDRSPVRSELGPSPVNETMTSPELPVASLSRLSASQRHSTAFDNEPRTKLRKQREKELILIDLEENKRKGEEIKIKGEELRLKRRLIELDCDD